MGSIPNLVFPIFFCFTSPSFWQVSKQKRTMHNSPLVRRHLLFVRMHVNMQGSLKMENKLPC